jgi:hypothetical protein
MTPASIGSSPSRSFRAPRPEPRDPPALRARGANHLQPQPPEHHPYDVGRRRRGVPVMSTSRKTPADAWSGPLPIEEMPVAIQVSDALDRRTARAGSVISSPETSCWRGVGRNLDFGRRANGLATGAADLSSPTMSRPLTAEEHPRHVPVHGSRAAQGRTRRGSDIRPGRDSLRDGHRAEAAYGRSQASLIASILKETPRPISALNRSIHRHSSAL